MRKPKLWWLIGTTVLVITALVLGLGLAVKQQPSFFSQSRLPPGTQRKAANDDLVRHFLQMMANLKSASWGCDATETEINSFFDETFLQLGEAESLRKLGITSPCVKMDGDHVRMAFRYGTGWFSTVISYDLKIWLVSKEANCIAVQVCSARAGAVPISCQSILHQLSEFATNQNFKVTPFRHEGTPVAVIWLQPDQLNPSKTLTTLEFSASKLSIRGKTSEYAQDPLTLKMTAVPSLQPTTPEN